MFKKLFRKKHRAVDASASSYVNTLLYRLKGLFTSSDEIVASGAEKIRERARELYHNAPLVKSYFNVLESNVIGKNGITLQMKSVNDKGFLDSKDNVLIERAWKDWGLYHASADGKYNFRRLQKLVLRTQKMEGEVFIRFITGDVNKYGFALEVIQPSLLDHTFNKELKSGNSIKMGIEYSKKYSRPIAYHFSKDLKNKGERTRIKAEEILHIQHVDECNATRGISALSPALSIINVRNDYMKAELIAAKQGATMFATITSESPDGIAGIASEKTVNKGIEKHALDLEPNDVLNLPPDVKLQTHSIDHPKTAFTSFVDTIDKSIAGALGVSYHALTESYEKVNYSSARTAEIQKRELYREGQEDIIDDFIRPVFNKWVSYSLLYGAFKFFNKEGVEKAIPNDTNKRLKYINGAKFIGRGWNWVDPLKEVKAYETAINNGFTSLQEVIKNHSGRDLEDVVEDHKQAKEIIEQAGISLGSNPIVDDIPDTDEDSELAETK
tara:strand:- start:7454 stop:8947 length:1494 start_codon:yes stop_codon:yes gene_type:complete